MKLEKHDKMEYNLYYKIISYWDLVRLSERKAIFQPEKIWGDLKMDVLKMLADLRAEREQIEEAIMTLERLARGRGRRRGRPPAWMSALKRRGRPPGSKNKPKNESKGSAAKTAAA